jgi:SsrA-binding protein
MQLAKTITILNKRASFEYAFLEKFVAGMQLQGTEIKSIRLGKANITDAYCTFVSGELVVRNMEIALYDGGTYYNHAPRRDRKLLLNKHEIKKLSNKLKDKGLTIIPTKLFINDKGYAKLEIALAKGKKLFDKREDIKERDVKRDLARKFRV